jgi:hypothetical protein
VTFPARFRFPAPRSMVCVTVMSRQPARELRRDPRQEAKTRRKWPHPSSAGEVHQPPPRPRRLPDQRHAEPNSTAKSRERTFCAIHYSPGSLLRHSIRSNRDKKYGSVVLIGNEAPETWQVSGMCCWKRAGAQPAGQSTFTRVLGGGGNRSPRIETTRDFSRAFVSPG